MVEVRARKSFFTKEPYSRETNILAFQWILKEAKTTGKGFVAVHVPRNLRDILYGVIPDELIRRLKSKGRIASSGIEIVRVTKNIRPYDGGNSPMVVYHPSMGLLKKLDTIPNISSVLAVPMTVGEIEEWIKTWNATELKLANPQADN